MSVARGPGPRHTPFSLVLAGGGARGYAHAGVLRALEHLGYRPSAVVGVSMGSLVAATYSLRADWYRALLDMDTSGFPLPGRRGAASTEPRIRAALAKVQVAWNMITGWGAPEQALVAGHRLLLHLLGDHDLAAGRVPVVVCATDLLSGGRVELFSGRARDAVYASSALAGIMPPLERDGALLADGAYTDVAPVDVARALDPPIVIAVDPTQSTGATDIHNGAQAVLRAMEICHLKHAELRFTKADLVIRPDFGAYIDTLDFGMRRECVTAGICATRAATEDLRGLLS